MSFRPLLRPGLRSAPQADGGVRLDDPPAGLSVDVPPAAAGLLPLLDGQLDAAQALAVSGTPAEVGAGVLRSLAMTGCLLGTDEEGRRRRIEARAAGPAHAEQAPFRLASHTRFECGACGACCRTVDFGPLTREEMDRLAAAPFVQADPALRSGPLFVQREDARDPWGRAGWTLARRDDGACVFLDGANRCRVYLELGPEARPLGCQVFPWVVQPASDGVVVADGLECATFSDSAAAGDPVYERFERLRPVLRAAARRAAAPARDGVRLACGVIVPAAHARLAVGRAIEVMDAMEGDWLAGAAAALGALAAHEALLLEEALGPGLGERVIDRLWAAPLDALAAGPDGVPSPEEVAAALGRLLARVSAALAPGWRAPRVGLVIEAIDGPLRRGLRQRLHGLALEDEGALAPAVAGALVGALLTAARARAAAAASGRRWPAPMDLDRVQPEVTRALREEAARAALRASQADAALLLHGGAGLRRALSLLGDTKDDADDAGDADDGGER